MYGGYYQRKIKNFVGLGIDLYQSDKKDTYSGVYMDITKNGISVKECKGRNVISNITKYIEKHCKQEG